VITTMIYTHVLKSAAAGTSSPLDGLMMLSTAASDDDNDDDGNGNSRPPFRAREPFFPCYRATPSFTAAAISAS